MKQRSVYCGEVTEQMVGKTLTVCGWVRTKRDMGGIVFIDLGDREGVLQVVFDQKDINEDEFKIADTLKNQSVISVTGVLEIRDEETYNAKIPTGTVELRAREIELLSQANTLPFPLEENVNVREDLRLQYRYLDLRRPAMIENLKFRHKLQRAAQDYLDDDGFLFVETPMLCKSTPEGARDYLVPSRIHDQSFYALPQSPQIFKQLLMVGGIDKYYQVARCFRDEDLRADRQPEFTQVDMEMSFKNQEQILEHLEKLFKHIFKKTMGQDITEAFPRLTWHEAMNFYGSDKPDIRFDLKIVDVTEIAKKCSFSVFKSVTKNNGIVRAINVKGKADFTRSEIEDLTEKAQNLGAKGMAWIAYRPDGEIYSILTKYFTEEEMKDLLNQMDAKPGDFILFSADKFDTVCKVLGGLRIEIAEMLGYRNPDEYKFLIVTDFPQFEWSEEQGRFMAMHHPFTMPYEEDMEFLFSDPARVRAQAYDFVLNGVELGSGSIRIHRSDIQKQMFEALGFNEEEIEDRFGFMVKAFSFGTPPHGGFAFGLDRLAMLLLGADSLRDVIAFPKNKEASCMMTNAPGPVDIKQLQELNLVGAFTESETVQKTKKAKHVDIDVKSVTKLAYLNFSTEQEKKMALDMSAIVDFANELSQVDTSNVEVSARTTDMQNVFHKDENTRTFDRADLLSNAKTKTEEYIYVPKSFE
ncbi:MAG: aspartate--tRNA ligase [Clostridia bacterium]